MKALSNVWVYVDAVLPFTDALGAGIEAARRSGGTLEVIAAIGRGEDRIFQTSYGAGILRMVREDRAARLRDVERLAKDALGPGRVNATLLEGELPWHSLVLHALSRAPDLLVVPARRGREGFDPAFEHLLRKCPAPVWAVLPGTAPSPRRVLAAVDPGLAGSAERRLARRVLDLARRLGANAALELHVVHAWSLPGEGLLRTRLGARGEQRQLEAWRSIAEQQLDQLVVQAELDRRAAHVHLLRGDPARVVPALAERLDADAVALGTTGRTGLEGFLLGGTAEAIVSRLGRSALLVKPDGFVSPVRPWARDEGAGRAA